MTRALLTGFLLYELTNDKKYAAFADAEAHIPRTTVVDPQEINTDAGFQGLIPHI